MAVRKLLFAKIETTEDTDVFGGIPADATNIIDTIDLQVTPYDGDTVTKDLDRHVSGNQEQVNTSPFVKLAFSALATGFGTAGTAALYDCLLRGCGFCPNRCCR